ncbi:MAG: exonuclease domain-containing protein, partial [Pauljensenia sp.]
MTASLSGHRPATASREVSQRLTEAVPVGVQVGLDQLGTPLEDVEWVVVDLETTGIGASASITEIGAVRVRGGDVLDEFQTLVDPEEPISPRITALTGITTSMVRGQPTIDRAYPDFARWAGLEDSSGFALPDPSCVLVAHNASFDIGFLRRAARSTGHEWAAPRVVDTLALARIALPRPMVRNHRLATLAGHFATTDQDRHRALGDARTTVEVLRGLIEVLAPLGVRTIEDVSTVGAPVPTRRRRRVALADDLPRSPGVYRFLDDAGAPLYVGSATNLRSRVRSYFTASESRAKVRRMLDVAADVRVTATSTLLEARVEELREIRALHPMFNSASTHQDHAMWVLQHGQGLEIKPVVTPEEAIAALGPFRGSTHARRAREALCATYAPAQDGPLLRLGRTDPDRAPAVAAALRGEHCEVLDTLVERMTGASDIEDFEGALRWRGVLSAYLAGLQRRADVVAMAAARR